MINLDLDYKKASLRSTYLNRRKQLKSEELASLNAGLIDQIKILDFGPINTAHIFLPIAKQGEPDTYRIMHAVNQLNPGVNWVVSRVAKEGAELYHFYFDKNTLIKENHWGIPEPIAGIMVPESKIDLVFVPLLVFDTFGHRVGYGKGYYDRFLSKCPATTLKVGLSLFDAVPKISDPNETDFLLDCCVTPTKTYWFNTKS